MFGMHGPELYLLFAILIGIPTIIFLTYLIKEKRIAEFWVPFLKDFKQWNNYKDNIILLYQIGWIWYYHIDCWTQYLYFGNGNRKPHTYIFIFNITIFNNNYSHIQHTGSTSATLPFRRN